MFLGDFQTQTGRICVTSALIGLDVSQMSCNLLAPRATKLNNVAVSPQAGRDELAAPADSTVL
jgi:hypothetical protein